MSERPPTMNAQEAFDPELRQANHELNDIYGQNRPYQDAEGKVHDPSTDAVVAPDEYFDSQRRIAEEENQTAYEDMSMSKLAHELGKAEFHGDKTSEVNISEVLLDKMAEFEAKNASTNPKRDIEHHNAQQSDNLLNRIRTIADKEIEGLKAKEAEKGAGPEETQNPVPASAASTTSTSGSNKPSGEQAAKVDVPSGASSTAGNGEPSRPKEAKPRKAGKAERKGGKYEFPNQKSVHYRARKDGSIQLGLDVDELGSVLDFNKHDKTNDLSNRKMMFTDAEGNHIYVRGQYMHTIGKFPEENPRVVTTFIGNNLTNLTVGQPLELADGWKTDLSIDRVQVATEIVDKNADIKAFDNKGYDPFEGADLLLAAVRRNLVQKRQAGGAGGSSPARHERITRNSRKRNKWLGALAAVALIGVGAGGFAIGNKGDSTRPAAKQKSVATKTHDKRHAASVTLSAGENPWTVSEQQLRAQGNLHPSQAQVAEYDAQMGADNDHEYSLNPDDHRAERLAVGTRLKLPSRRTVTRR